MGDAAPRIAISEASQHRPASCASAAAVFAQGNVLPFCPALKIRFPAIPANGEVAFRSWRMASLRRRLVLSSASANPVVDAVKKPSGVSATAT